MSTSTEDMAERQGRMLAELSELTLKAARNLQERVVAAETHGEAAQLGLAFERVSRSLRQTLMLEAKLSRERRAAAQETALVAEKAREARHRERRRLIELAAELVIAEASESPEQAEALMDDLEPRLDAYLLDPKLEGMSLDDLVGALRDDLDLTALDAADDTDEIDAAPASEVSAPGAADPAPEPAEPAPPNPSYDVIGGKLVMRDPDHGGWRVVGDSS